MLQRADGASVRVAGEVVASFEGEGLVVLLGVTHTDGPEDVAWMARKIADLRLLTGERSLLDAHAPALVISQFTLYGDVRKGRRPTWLAAAPGPVAEPVYHSVCAAVEGLGVPVLRGVFGADMSVALTNDGPVTLSIESPLRGAR